MRQKTLFDEFLKKAVAESVWSGGSLKFFLGSAPPFLPTKAQKTWEHVTRDDVHRFEQLLGASALDGAFYSLSPQQCEVALAEIIQNDVLIPGVMLLQRVDISKWCLDSRPIATQSQMTLHYGMKPCISMFLTFETIDQFGFIKRVFADLQLCKLNEKHLKPMR